MFQRRDLTGYQDAYELAYESIDKCRYFISLTGDPDGSWQQLLDQETQAVARILTEEAR